MNKKEFYNKFEKYLHDKNMNTDFIDKTDCYKRFKKWFTNSKYTKKGDDEYEYHLVRVGKILMFKKFKTGGVK